MTADWYKDPELVLDELRRDSAEGGRKVPEIVGYSDLVEYARGGQGVVYTAIQDSTSRRVAIKLLSSHSDEDVRAQRRFEREIDMVARLRHPGIVRLYDSGSTVDGRLYCVMDFIEGVPLDEFLGARLRPGSSEESAPLGEPRVIALFHSISLAVKHAHQHGVIHRDLKPSNIRVDGGGVPHVLDFGLAKTIDPSVESMPTVTGREGGFAGSLPWASPEQVAGDPAELDTRTDVYSIGVMLYHAVAGAFPYEVRGPVRDVLNAIVETDPTPLRTRRPDVDRDLEAVVVQCLEKDKERRYQSAAELGEDLRRLQAGEPVLAQADSRWYSIRRSLRRYRFALTAAVVSVIALAVFGVAMSVLYGRAVRAEERTARERHRAESVNDFLERMLASASPANLGRDVTVREMISQAAEDLEEDQGLPATVRAALHSVIAHTWMSLGQYEPALESARQAIAISRAELGERARSTIEYRNVEASVLVSQSRYAEAKEGLVATLADARDVFGDDAPVTLSAWSNFAQVRSEEGDFEEAIEIHERVWRARHESLGEAHPLTVASLRHLAVEESWAGRRADAQEHYELAARLIDSTHGADHPDAILVRSSLAVTIRARGDDERANAMLAELVPRAERVLGPDHRDTNVIRSNLAYGLAEVGQREQALELMELVYTSTLEHLGPTHTDTLNAMNGVALALHRLQRFDDAALLLEDAYALSLEAFGPLHFRSLDSGANLAQALQRLGRLDDAIQVALESLDHAREFYDGKPHADLAWFTKVAGDIQLDRNEPLEALPLLEESYELSALSERDRLPTLRSLVRAWVASGQPDGARELLEGRLAELAAQGADDATLRATRDLLSSVAR